ncbi:DUF1254 domain-containing protein [Paraburkholderia sp. J76]|uniref:DUF1254 domain-containing protein n=1 Tax=Paraburkholderia sp. J76 TaxID=2805439 RepID=UPI002ABD6948|nr:DUF1254 domain-containing protein [Paraburkholderia sp. J76]
MLASTSNDPAQDVPGHATLTPAQARLIARDAYVYGFPLVDNYRVLHTYFSNSAHPEFKAPWNRLHNEARVYTHEDTVYPTPNSDTPYSQLGADLRAEPLVITVPKVDEGRYYSLQFVDLNTFNFAYVGSRATGNGAGRYLLAGPAWQGETPPGIDRVIRSETQLAFVFFRTQLFGPADIENVKAVQAGYAVETLSAWLGRDAPPAASPDAFKAPLDADAQRHSLAFFDVLNHVLQYCTPHPEERTLRERFARLGIGTGATFDASTLPPQIRSAIADGMADAWNDCEALGKRIAAGTVSTADLLGSREFLQGNYLYRMRACATGLYGNSKEETLYPPYYLDTHGEPLNGASHRYVLRYAPGQLPPVHAFWSLTLYALPSRLLIANPLGRYLINSAMLPDLKRDPDGGVTIHVQADSPGAGRESNWLPAPHGPFVIAGRLYWPRPEALNGTWKAPGLQRAE